jgi:hypothetical protein
MESVLDVGYRRRGLVMMCRGTRFFPIFGDTVGGLDFMFMWMDVGTVG